VRYAVEDCEYGKTSQRMTLHFTCGARKRRRDVVQIRGDIGRRELHELAFFAFFGFYNSTFGNNEPV
jgi:hypothetical protein